MWTTSSPLVTFLTISLSSPPWLFRLVSTWPGCWGLAEEDAIAQHGEDNIEVYHQNFWPLEWTVAHRPENSCYLKLITLKTQNEKVIGFHYLGPNAGEVTQGFGIALKMGATKADFDNLIGIHPTTAENFTTVSITKRSGVDASASGC